MPIYSASSPCQACTAWRYIRICVLWSALRAGSVARRIISGISCFQDSRGAKSPVIARLAGHGVLGTLSPSTPPTNLLCQRGGRLEHLLQVRPEAQGKGFASELVQAAIPAARALRPELPVTALLLERNFASKSVAEKSGLNLVWCGPDKGNPDPDAVCLVYADRNLTPDIVRVILAHT